MTANVVDQDGHDIVVVGASAGGVEALRRLIGALDADFAGAMFVVLHLPTNAHSALPSILNRAGRVPVTHAVDGQAAELGHVYVAPPDAHLLVKPGRMQLLKGPTENGHRPAIDPLFRSAAEAYGGRVIGVVLSGVLDDGTQGLLSIAGRGGLTVAQDPDDALFPAMPANAIDTVPVDFVASAAEIGSAIQRLMRTPRPAPNDARAPGDDVTELALEGGGALEMHGRPSRFTCPDCGGSLWDASEEEPGKFRCRVGHSWTTAGLVERQALTLEQALWTALRALSERADLARRLRDQAAARNHDHGRELFHRQLEEYEQRADVIRDVLRSPEPAAGLPLALVNEVAPSAELLNDEATPRRKAL
jgi:two-component system, chemotaxis family, protein-glutamate methylesterase/glutaminase